MLCYKVENGAVRMIFCQPYTIHIRELCMWFVFWVLYINIIQRHINIFYTQLHSTCLGCGRKPMLFQTFCISDNHLYVITWMKIKMLNV